MVEQRPTLGRPRRSGGEGIPEVFCVDEQRDHPVDLERWRNLCLAALELEGVRGGCELSVMFVDKTTIAELNAQYMGKIGPTDVLAFPLDGLEVAVAQGPGAITHSPSTSQYDHGDSPLLLGDVVVCPSVAAEQASSHAGTYDDELALLIVHGILHVLGHDHDDDENTTLMRARELSILRDAHWHGEAPHDFRQAHDE